MSIEHGPVPGTIEFGKNHKEQNPYLPLSWNLDLDAAPSEEVRRLIIKERSIPVIIERDTSLRPKILDACGLTCTFCHNEGTPVAAQSHSRVSVFTDYNGVDFTPARMAPDDEFGQILSRMRDSAGIREIHLTGGEPTLHGQLPEIIRLCKDRDLKVKFTSNGENGVRVLEDCAKAGLDGVVFSIFGTTAEELADVQHEKYRMLPLAERKLEALKASIALTCKLGLKASGNIVMPDSSHQDRVRRVLEEFSNGLSVRVLNSLERGDESYFAIYQLLAQLKAEPELARLTAGSSSSRVDYRLPTGRKIIFKQIRPTRFSEVCDDCHVDEKGDCEEGFYGLRLYRAREDQQYRVGFCIQRMDTAMDTETFFQGEIPELIKGFRDEEVESIKRAVDGKMEVIHG